MHGSSFNGDTERALQQLADLYDGLLREAPVPR